MADHDDADISVQLRIPRSAFMLQAAPPDLLSQKNVLAACGIPPRQFLDILRTALLPVTRLGRLRLVDRPSFVEWIKSRAKVSERRRPLGTPAVSGAARAAAPDPVEALARRLGAQVSPQLAEAAGQEVRELEAQMEKILPRLNLKPVGPRDPAHDLKTARLTNKWAAEKIGDRKAVERFARELGQEPCPTCSEWTERPPCHSCRTKARLAARVPCSTCEKQIDPCKDGLCRACRKSAKAASADSATDAPTAKRAPIRNR